MTIELFDMTTPLGVSDARTADILAVSELWNSIGDSNTEAIAHNPETLRGLMDGLDYLVMRDTDSPRLVGAVSVMDCQRGLAKIDSLAVMSEFQGQGRGRRLACAALQHCTDNGFKEVATVAMPSSQRLFTSLGFEIFEMYDSGNASMFKDL